MFCPVLGAIKDRYQGLSESGSSAKTAGGRVKWGKRRGPRLCGMHHPKPTHFYLDVAPNVFWASFIAYVNNIFQSCYQSMISQNKLQKVHIWFINSDVFFFQRSFLKNAFLLL